MDLKEISVKWGKAVYYKTNSNSSVQSIPLTELIRDEDIQTVDYIIRLYLANDMRQKLLQKSSNLKNVIEIYPSLPAKALAISSTKFVNAQRILNWSIYIISQVIQSPPSYFFYSRDPKIPIPSSEYNINDLLKRVMTMCQSSDDDDDDLNMTQLLSVISGKMFRLFNQKKRKLDGGSKKSALVIMENELSRSVENVQKMLYQYKDEILENIKNCQATKSFLQIRDNDPHTPVYVNTNMSFSILFHTTGEILNTFLIDIVSRLSMTDAMNASIFHLLYLNEVNLLEDFIHQVNLPILNRLILSCFPSPSPPTTFFSPHPLIKKLPPLPTTTTTDLENWIKENEELVYSVLNEIIKKKEDDDDKLLYWSINKERGNTLEYYLIVILRQYVQVLNLASSSRLDRELNRKIEIISLWKFIVCFYHYVTSIPPELRSVHIFSEFTFGNNPTYKKIIQNALREFFKHQ